MSDASDGRSSDQTSTPLNVGRRHFIKLIAVSSSVLMAPAVLAACGSNSAPVASSASSGSSAPSSSPATSAAASSAPSAAAKTGGGKIKLGFIALTDASSLIMAGELGLFKKYGLDVDVVKQASWASTRDNLLTNEIQGCHCLFGMPFSVYTGVGGTAGKELYITMMLNQNGQALTLSNDFKGKVGYADLAAIKSVVEQLKGKKEVTFAMTFPGGTHDMWLRYMLAAANIDQKAVKIITVPPPQMVANMKVGNMDGFVVGEPWGGIAVQQGIGFTELTTQDMWKTHPEKAFVVTPEFAKRRDEVKLAMRAILEASKYIDDPKNTSDVAKIVGKEAYVNATADVLDARLAGNYDLGGGLGSKAYTDDTMRFYNDGFVNMPRKGHAAWFMTQYVRFGYLKELPDIRAISDKLILADLYKEVAKDMSIPLPDDDMSPFTIGLDGAKFDPASPGAYLKQYGVLA